MSWHVGPAPARIGVKDAITIRFDRTITANGSGAKRAAYDVAVEPLVAA